ncbi:MAG: type II secretion system GspH family protein [Rubrivivax sp.]|nr:type II secretion system GspH family protein [Rubrivivax sp.]
MNRSPRRPSVILARSASRGVTLVELIIVLTIVGVIASLGATLVGRLATEQQAQRGRLNLAQSADGALAQVQTALQQALPNSLRVTVNAAGVWIEWIPLLDAGVARQAADATGTPSNPLDITDPLDTSFDVLGVPIATPSVPAWLVFQNLGMPESDAYLGNNRRAGLALSNGGSTVSFAAAGAVPAGNGSGRFFVVAAPQSIACRPAVGGGYALWRYSGYGWQSAQPVSDGVLTTAATSLLASGLESCEAGYSQALANIGLLTLRLVAVQSEGTARMTLVQQVALDNTP